MARKVCDPKHCKKCDTYKPRSEFYKHAVSPNGVHSDCKECEKKELKKSWSKLTKEEQALRQRNNKLKINFGITLDDYDLMLRDQNGCCAICKSNVSGGKGAFHVDHCHKTGKIRGLLCHYCNTGLGIFKDDINLLSKAISYLLENGD